MTRCSNHLLFVHFLFYSLIFIIEPSVNIFHFHSKSFHLTCYVFVLLKYDPILIFINPIYLLYLRILPLFFDIKYFLCIIPVS